MKSKRDRREATFIEHLEELRKRIIRCAVYVIVGAVACWVFKDDLMLIAQAPLHRAAELAGVGVEVKVFGLAEAFVISLQIAVVAGIILASPFWLMEAWLFIEPALEDHERKWVVPLLPAAVGLFMGGVMFCYWLAPRAFKVLIGFHLQLGVSAPELMLKPYLTLFLRLLLVFGVMFELPLVIMFLSAVGIVKSEWLLKYWRMAVVIIAIVAAVVTPTPDAVTLCFLAGPMVALYMLSILLARMVEKGKAKRRAEDEAEFGGDDDDEGEPVETAPVEDYTPPEDPYYEYQDYTETEPPDVSDDPEPVDAEEAAERDVEEFGDPYGEAGEED